MLCLVVIYAIVPDLSTTEHIERTLTSKLQEVKGAITEQWKQLQVNSHRDLINVNYVHMLCSIQITHVAEFSMPTVRV